MSYRHHWALVEGGSPPPDSPSYPGIVDFARSQLDFHPDPVQEQVLLSAHRSGILNCTRQWGKSTLAAAMLVYEAFTRPKSLSLVVSYTQDQSLETVEKAREFMGVLGIRVTGDGIHKRSLKLPNGSRILGLPTKQGRARGYSKVSLMIVDEAAQVPDFVYAAMRPSMAISRGRVWLLSTPFGKRGFFWREWDEGGEEWARFQVTAEECPRYDPEFLAGERRRLSAEGFAQEYCGSFAEANGVMFSQRTVEDSIVEDASDWKYG